MKTLNLNRITLLTTYTLFLAATAFSNSASALCVANADGAIVTVDGNSGTPVRECTQQGCRATDACTVTPDYKLNIYKFGLCKSDPDLNDLSSCQFFFDQAAGVEVDIKAGVSATLPIPEFDIEPGTYPYLYVLSSSKLGMKWSSRMTNNVNGASGSGTYCWTSNTGMRASNYGNNGVAMTTVHGTTLNAWTKTIDCGSSAGTPVFTYEIVTKLSDSSCSSTFNANGDRTALDETQSAQLLTVTDTMATSCANSAKIAWTTDLETSYVVTEDSSFAMSIKATAASLGFSDDDNDNNINSISLDSLPPRIYLTVTD